MPQVRAHPRRAFPRSRSSRPSTAGRTTAPTRPASSTPSSTSASSRTASGTARYHSKAELIDAINQKLAVFPGITFNYTQPAEDAVDEAETGLKSALDVKVFGPDLAGARGKGPGDQGGARAGARHRARHRSSRSSASRASRSTSIATKIARYGINVADVNGLIEAAVGGAAATAGGAGREARSTSSSGCSRSTARRRSRSATSSSRRPDGQQIPLRELADIGVNSGASFIYREDNSRYIGVQYSRRGTRSRGRGRRTRSARSRAAVPLPPGYRVVWGGEYEEYTASRDQLAVVLPLTLALIFLLLFALYRNFKFPLITVIGVLLSAPVGGLLALPLTGTPFSVSSGIGFLALFGVSVQTAVVYISYANELRQGGWPSPTPTREAALLRLRPIMMTALVAALGLLPAALSTGVGSDSQRPFALVIVGGLFSRLLISVFLMPALYAFVAREDDRLEV